MKLIKHNNTRMMFRETNSLGDQIITITDYDNDVVTKRVRYEGDWFTGVELDALLLESKDINVIKIHKLLKREL